MKLTRWVATGLPALALLAAFPLAAHAAARPAADATGILGCDEKLHVHPGEFDIACDGSWYLSGIRWTTWNRTMATGTAVSNVDNCLPNCATGKFIRENAVVVFWRPMVLHHQRSFTEITVLYPKSGHTQTVTAAGA